MGRASEGLNLASRLLILPSCTHNSDQCSLYPARSDRPWGEHRDFPPAGGRALWARGLLVPVCRLELSWHHQEPQGLRPHCMWVLRRCGRSEGKISLCHVGGRFCIPPAGLCVFWRYGCVLKFSPSDAQKKIVYPVLKNKEVFKVRLDGALGNMI